MNTASRTETYKYVQVVLDLLDFSCSLLVVEAHVNV